MKTINLKTGTAVMILGILLMQACSTYYFRSGYDKANEMIHDTGNLKSKPFLKAHFKNGDVCILKNTWEIDTVKNIITGTGSLYDYNRVLDHEGAIEIPLDSIVIFETNKKLTGTEAGRTAALGILTGVDVVMGILCITNPKACYGSCPTFYINENDNFHYSDAEGFSSAISPSMEYADIDALNNQKLLSNEFSITMKNEALETHCIKEIKLLAFPRNNGERIYQSPADEFYLCENINYADKITGEEGNITDLMRNEDRRERFSPADENNLSSREEIYLNFKDVKNCKDPGLVIHFRQSLMTTYFIYSAIGYMGNEAGDFFAEIENGSGTGNKVKNGIIKELGNIDVYCRNDKTGLWEFQNSLNETGPIAINRQFIPLSNIHTGSDVKVKLVLNKGLWRIDFAALANIKEKITPVEISPDIILNKEVTDNNSLSALLNPEKYLISMPGSEYKITFTLPQQDQDYELFLKSKGYYLEWIREHWIKDKNLPKLYQMIEHPKEFLRSEAKDYKLYESSMEDQFWNSKIDTKNFSYYED